ncbi:MAG TPA: hypothetical protein VF420_07725 [Casimicrobiaceae bacterium]
MSLAALLPAALALGICLAPVWMLRRRTWGRTQDYFVSAGPTRPEVVRNSSVAYGLRMSAFGLLFAWGASGDLWALLIASACFGLGIRLIYFLARPLLEFIDDALSRERSVTVAAFIANQHGGDSRVRVLAAGLTVIALLGFLICEALAAAAFLRPILPSGAATIWLLAIATVVLMLLHAVPSGHSGVMQSSQLQLGMVWFGLLGAALILLYLHFSARGALLPYGTFAIAAAALCCGAMLGYRRTKYVDTDFIPTAVSGLGGRDASRGARALSRFGKLFNVALSVLLALIIALALIGFHGDGVSRIARDALTALSTGTKLSAAALLTLCLVTLLQPLVDVANWQRLAAARKDQSGLGPGEASVALRGIYRIYALEGSLGWLLMGLVGAIAVAAMELPTGARDIQGLAVHLGSNRFSGAGVAFSLLLIFVGAAALSTMSGMFSAALCTIRYDLLPALSPRFVPGQRNEATAIRQTLVAGIGLCVAFATAFCVAGLFIADGSASNAFLALLLASSCAQLSLAPLVVGPLIWPTGGREGASPRWAVVILGAAAASGVAAVTAFVLTGAEACLWSAVPACLGSGVMLFAIARARRFMPT